MLYSIEPVCLLVYASWGFSFCFEVAIMCFGPSILFVFFFYFIFDPSYEVLQLTKNNRGGGGGGNIRSSCVSVCAYVPLEKIGVTIFKLQATRLIFDINEI